MKKYLLWSLLGVAAILGFASCSSDNDSEEIYRQSASDCFELVSDIANGGVAGYSNIGYVIEYNYSRMQANVSVSNLRLPDGTSFPTMTFSAIPFEIKKNGWIVLTAERTQPSIPGFGSTPTFYNFQLSIINRDFSGTNYPGFCFRTNVDMNYSILSAPAGTLLLGTTTTTAADGKSETRNTTKYTVRINPETRMMDIVMGGAQFIDGMPAMDIKLPSIPFEVTGSVLSFDVPMVVPMIGSSPFPAFPITNLKGSYDFRKGMDMSFHCAPRTTPDEYDVDVKTDFTYNELQGQ